ncbi:MAG: aldose 1-epimerase family protein [Kiritimatiellae bacterium]|nr:aldose 1-epimerase family protein [Kiritimatiellia bacterium]
MNPEKLTRAEKLRRIGHLAQLGGTRHYVLSDGRASGVSAVDMDTGTGLAFTVLPGRGLDISRAGYKGTNLVYLTPNGEVHPAYYEPQGEGWLRTFFGGLLTTCGLTYLGQPGKDGETELGLHGRYAATPARQVCDLSAWDGDRYVMKISGVIEECALFGDKLRLTRTVTSAIGSRSLTIRDEVENFGYAPSPFTILYHINVGHPLLDEGAELALTALNSEPFDAQSADAVADMLRCSGPVPGFEEQNFQHDMGPNAEGDALAGLVNRKLGDGLGLYVKFDSESLPYLNEWKMMGEGDYVLAIEPANAPCKNRAVLRKTGRLPFLAPGEIRTIEIEIGVLDGGQDLDAFVAGCKTTAE